MTMITRRAALGAIASIPAIGGSIAAPAAPGLSPITTSLQDALLACQSAEDQYSACHARETAIAEALGDRLFPKWTAPGGVRSIWSHRPKPFGSSAELEAEIARKLGRVEESFASSMMDRAAYNRWMADIATARSEGLTSLRQQEAYVKASGYVEAFNESDEAFEEARAALAAVMIHPCETIEDVRAKAACIIRTHQRVGVDVDGDDLVACLSSLCEVA
ncbi:hypothetical protein [Mesorhizobium sangaii]|uniref:Uncharacterized protein n=1 Tax=Mesorhizobium sangaii TaxID=505389 RepID=A0A841P3K5_9HYPH|nr:hypothetical protein [Mesorhizobium sangaii]MBB6407448.1 hypothetical protein [Mesorhizobium sangaii]